MEQQVRNRQRRELLESSRRREGPSRGAYWQKRCIVAACWMRKVPTADPAIKSASDARPHVCHIKMLILCYYRAPSGLSVSPVFKSSHYFLTAATEQVDNATRLSTFRENSCSHVTTAVADNSNNPRKWRGIIPAKLCSLAVVKMAWWEDRREKIWGWFSSMLDIIKSAVNILPIIVCVCI